jgi:hypothetical protein
MINKRRWIKGPTTLQLRNVKCNPEIASDATMLLIQKNARPQDLLKRSLGTSLKDSAYLNGN